LIVTDQFVFLHYPKTGGLFVAEVLKKLHTKTEELMLPNVKRIHGASVRNQHGTYEQIPQEHRGKPLIACIRNPFDRYVSTYEYRRWLNRTPAELIKIKARFPAYPDLDFSQYLEFINIFDIENRTYGDRLKVDVGVITYSFIQFFFKDPERIILNLNEAYINSDAYKMDIPEIVFLHTENLNRELYEALVKFGHDKKDVSFVLEEKKVNVTSNRKPDKDWKDYYSEELLDYVRFKERFILRLFPEYDMKRGAA
jgi:hypothetical protein